MATEILYQRNQLTELTEGQATVPRGQNKQRSQAVRNRYCHSSTSWKYSTELWNYLYLHCRSMLPTKYLPIYREFGNGGVGKTLWTCVACERIIFSSTTPSWSCKRRSHSVTNLIVEARFCSPIRARHVCMCIVNSKPPKLIPSLTYQ